MVYEHICRLLLKNGVRLVHTTSRTVGETLKKVSAGGFRSEVSLNEKTAFELALTGSYAGKRTACLFTTEEIYEALDPVMSSAYTGVIGGFLIICVKETDQEATPLGLFSKIPFIAAENGKDLARAVEFGYGLSERHETPVMIQTTPEADEASQEETSTLESPTSKSVLTKNPDRWAATPKYRYQLHRALNDRIKAVSDDFARYEGNKMVIDGRSGLITDRQEAVDIYGEDLSLLYLSTLYPIPSKLLEEFMGQMDRVFLVEGDYPVIELQIQDRSKVKVEHLMGRPPGRRKPQETMFGFDVTRDNLGPGSSINMAHGRKKLEPESRILAITYEDFFFHSGMASIVNALYNDSSFVVLIMANEREDEMKKVLNGFGLSSCFHIDKVSEVERFKDQKELTVLFCKGII
jgi:TPP-dependent indolepyruvate ferredoxin oxidoreductase alpha subunit